MPADRLRILQIMRAPIGGLFRHVNDLTHELAERGHHVGVVVDSLVSDGLTEKRLDMLAASADLGIHKFPMPRLLGPGDLTTPLAARRLAERLGVQILHGHGAKGGVSARVARMGRKNSVAVYTTHGGVLHHRPGKLQTRVFFELERALLRHTDALVFESAFALRTFSTRIATPTCPAPVIHNGLSKEEFEPVMPRADAADFVYIGEFSSAKGVDFMMRALVAVRAPDGRPATLVAAGDGAMMGEIRQLVDTMGLRDRVRLLGVAPARPTLSMGRCMILPSLAESLPYVVLEGAAAGLPVIATDVGGISELFGPLATRLIPPSDQGALTRAMQAYLDDPATAHALAAEHVNFLRPRFSISAMTDGIETLYHQALATRQRSIARD